ncbi:MAG TPA: aldehyde dehydrogenase family protein, partial [Dehalococcoidia bacterium]
MKMYVAGEWIGADTEIPVHDPYSGDLIDTVPSASARHVDRAVTAAVAGAAAMRQLTAHQRAEILNSAANGMERRLDELAHLLSREEGKPLVESRAEVGRCPELLRLCTFEATQIRGETLPLDAAPNGAGKLGFAIREPCGVVAAITPFNFPLLLVVHKVGPALAAGNAVILKPAGATPLVALALTELLIEAGLPELALQCITGPGAEIGPLLCADPRVRKVSFTGSAEVGEAICRVAGIKRMSLELGSNCPLIVLPDADIGHVAAATAIGGYSNAGQVCISTQRVLAHHSVYPDLLDALSDEVSSIPTGDPLKEQTRLSAMISISDADRVGTWIDEAVKGGARVVTGGEHDGAIFEPTVVADVDPEMRISRQELFGPAVGVTPVTDIEQALALANDSDYGLSAGIFTRD